MITGVQVIIDSVDQTANLTGEVLTCDIEENAARTASFTLLLILGVSELLGWVGKSVVIKSVIDAAVKTEFTGVIDSPSKDIETGLTTFSCTDNMQEIFETKTKTEIDAIIAAYWSEAVFNDSDGWEYAQERLSTIPSSISLDELNVSRVTGWAAKAIPDYTFTDSGYIFGSLRNDSIADRRNIINGVDIELDYRYIRLKHREQAYSWLDTGDVCDFYTNPYPIPTQERIYNSILQTGWQITIDPTFTLPPPSGLYTCGLDDIAWIQNTTLAQGVDFSIAKRYSQNITEKYTIRVESADSIAALGDISVKQTAALATAYETSDWDASDVNDGFADYGVPSTDINNDEYINKDDATERQNAIDTAVNVAKTRILSSHRNGNIVSFEIPYHQDIDEINTALLSSTKLTAKGKIYNVVKKINTLTGRATTQIFIKLSKPFGVGVPSADDPVVIPDALPTVTDTQIVDLNLLSHLGGQDPTVYDQNWSGWITDYDTVTEPGHVPYPTEFVVHTPAITLNSIDNIDAADISLINVTIPDDTLS